MKKVLLGTTLISSLTISGHLFANSMIKVPLDINGDNSIMIPLPPSPNKSVINSYAQSLNTKIIFINHSKNKIKKIIIKND